MVTDDHARSPRSKEEKVKVIHDKSLFTLIYLLSFQLKKAIAELAKNGFLQKDAASESEMTLTSLEKFKGYFQSNIQRLIKSEYLMKVEEDSTNPKFSVCFVELATYLEGN